jgi:hypothetical protein
LIETPDWHPGRLTDTARLGDLMQAPPHPLPLFA